MLAAVALLGSEPAAEARKPIRPTPPSGPFEPTGPQQAIESPEVPENGPKPPLVKPTATVWAQAGSRSWTGCSKIANEAAKQLFAHHESINNFRENHHWAIQAGECPNAPEILTMAARAELLRRFDLPEGLDAKTDLGLIEVSLSESRARASAWLRAAEAELRRRRDPLGLGLGYWRGRSLLSINELDQAHAAFAQATRRSIIEGWRLRRLLALTELYAGDLEAALVQANRALIDAPQSDRLVSLYVIALVLDRAGDTAGAARRMKSALARDGDRSQMRSLEAALPIHERLYLRAYAKTIRREASGALRLWDAYLARPQPEDPERRLAERHRNSLEPLPTNLGGPPHPDEGRAASGSSGH